MEDYKRSLENDKEIDKDDPDKSVLSQNKSMMQEIDLDGDDIDEIVSFSGV